MAVFKELVEQHIKDEQSKVFKSAGLRNDRFLPILDFAPAPKLNVFGS